VDITKKQLASLIDDVILKFQDEHLLDYIKTSDEKYRHDVLLTKFLVMFFDKSEEKLHKNFFNLLDYYDELGITYIDVKYALAHLFKEYKKWINNYDMVKESYYEKVSNVYKNIFNNYSFANTTHDKEDDSSDDFFFLEDTGVDNSIDGMHYEDAQKISAEKYFELYPIDNSDLEDIAINKDILVEILDDYLEYSEEFLEKIISTLRKLDTSLQLTFANKDFKDIGMGIENLIVLLENLDKTSIDGNEEILYNILVTFIEDLVKWLDSIFILQSAVDIHYLDASLLANVEQLQIVLNPLEDEDDDFLF